jgi:hypothetical protein
MLRKLSKTCGLSRQKREKGVIYVEDLAVIMQTNLTTTKKKYTHGRQTDSHISKSPVAPHNVYSSCNSAGLSQQCLKTGPLLRQAVRTMLATLEMADVNDNELYDSTLCIGHTGKL